MEEEKVSSLTAEEAKAAGNDAFKQNNFQAAVKLYTESLGKLHFTFRPPGARSGAQQPRSLLHHA